MEFKKIHNRAVQFSGSRELFVTDKQRALIKILEFNEIYPDMESQEIIDGLRSVQGLASSVFGKNYLKSRFPTLYSDGVGEANKIITFEKYLPNIYPSANHVHTIDLCFVGHMGLQRNQPIPAYRYHFILYFLDDSYGEYSLLRNSHRQEQRLFLYEKIIDDPAFSMAINNYLDCVRMYYDSGFYLDLMGMDNVVGITVDQSQRVLVNNSATKLWSTFDLNSLTSQVINTHIKSDHLINCIAFMVNCNMLCDMSGKDRIFTSCDYDMNLIASMLLQIWGVQA